MKPQVIKLEWYKSKFVSIMEEMLEDISMVNIFWDDSFDEIVYRSRNSMGDYYLEFDEFYIESHVHRIIIVGGNIDKPRIEYIIDTTGERDKELNEYYGAHLKYLYDKEYENKSTNSVIKVYEAVL